MQAKGRLLCFWGGYSFFPLYLLGIVVLAGFIPPPSPNLTGAEIVALFDLGRMPILLGMAICVFASALYIPWSVSISAQMRRIESSFPEFSSIQMLCGAVGAAFFMISPLVWAAMAFRSGRDPDLMLILNDFAWISWLISWPFFLVQEFAVGFCVLFAKRDQTVYPRWLAFYSICGASTMFPVLMILFFKSGPFAWTGLFGIYLPLVLFAIWFHLVSYMVLRAIRGEAASKGAVDVRTVASTA